MFPTSFAVPPPVPASSTHRCGNRGSRWSKCCLKANRIIGGANNTSCSLNFFCTFSNIINGKSSMLPIGHPVPPPSGVAMVAHGWACAHPTSARVGREICTNLKTFWRSRGGRGSRLRMSLKVHCISSMNTLRKCVCPLQIVYAYLASGGFASDPHRDSVPVPCWGTSVPQTQVPSLPPNLGYATG